MLIAIDPGPERSACVCLTPNDGNLRPPELVRGDPLLGIHHNGVLLTMLRERAETWHDLVVVENVACYGMPVGEEVFETCKMIGAIRYVATSFGNEYREISRPDIKLALCGTQRAKDPNVRQRLIDLYGPGRAAAIGTKRKPGPLYGVSSHLWAALAVGVAYIIA